MKGVKMNVIEIKYEDKIYPEELKKIANPPKTLYCLGDISLLKTKMISVVGSRKCTEYGKNVALKIGECATKYEVTVVSGMAKGIDYFSHYGALNSNGKTIAVLGCGVNICYPKTSRDIYDKIKKTGLLISEYEPNCMPRPQYFPLRNRIVSALSDATIVVEAEISSGSMITAEIANEQGKSVYAIPGSIFSLSSFGTNKLIQDGGRIVLSIEDVFKDLGYALKMDEYNLSDAERNILSIVKNTGEISIKELAKMLNYSGGLVKNIVGELAIKGCVFYELGKVFIAN